MDATLAWRPARGGPVSVRVPVGDESRVGEARRAADAIARACGLDEHARGTLGIVVTEAATNLARHARDGLMLFRDTGPTGLPGVEMLAVDRGPGMQDLSRFFADGYSTAGTQGQGLGAMKRQAHELDVYSTPGEGTIVVGRVFAAAKRAAQLVDAGVVCMPVDGESACGDGWCISQSADAAMVLLTDGLGHGPHAAEAADTASTVFRAVAANRSPKEIVSLIHDALRATRGAAVSVAEIRRSEGGGATVNFCGVGNTVTALIGPAGSKALPSTNGTAGLTINRLQELTLPWPAGAMMVMHTDGITTRWRLDAYKGILEHDPAVATAVLYRDFTRGRDDATVLTLRLRGAP